jgi:hypothetical protein
MVQWFFWKTLQGVGKACYCLDEHRVLKSFIVLDSSRIKKLRIFLPSTNRRPGTNRKPGLRSINTRTSDKFTIGYPTETPNPNVKNPPGSLTANSLRMVQDQDFIPPAQCTQTYNPSVGSNNEEQSVQHTFITLTHNSPVKSGSQDHPRDPGTDPEHSHSETRQHYTPPRSYSCQSPTPVYPS